MKNFYVFPKKKFCEAVRQNFCYFSSLWEQILHKNKKKIWKAIFGFFCHSFCRRRALKAEDNFKDSGKRDRKAK